MKKFKKNRGLFYYQIVDALKRNAGSKEGTPGQRIDGASKATVNKHLHDHLIKDGIVRTEYVQIGNRKRPVFYLNKFVATNISFRPIYNVLEALIEIQIDKEKHYRVTYNLVNQSNETQQQFVMFAYGDKPRSWEKLNPKVIVEVNGTTKIIYDKDKKPKFLRNDPFAKRFQIDFGLPIYPGQDVKVTFEYDWDDPAQYWEYTNEYQPKVLKFVVLHPRSRFEKVLVSEIERMTRKTVISPIEPEPIPKKSMLIWNWERENASPAYTFMVEWK